MKFELPRIKLKKPTQLRLAEKRFDKKWRAFKKTTAKKFKFISVWRKNTAHWFTKVGDAIVRVSPPWLRRVGRIVWIPFGATIRRIKAFLARRPHRSFRLTRRRDYVRSLKMPGYWSFTNSVRAMLWKNKFVFGGLALTYLALAYIFNSFGQQEAYQNLSDALYSTGGELFEGQWGKVAGSGILLLTAVTTGLTPNMSSAQTVLGGLAVFYAWLATVWALRNIMAGRKVKVRDAIYNSGAPVVSTMLVAFILVVQILPLSIAMMIYNAAVVTQFIGGVESMLAWVAIALLAVLSIYWIASTIIALVVVTLPGMYPWRAIRTAGDLIVGRRLRVVLRFVWLALMIVVTWAIILIPIILFDDWLKKVWPVINWMPIVPLSILVMSSVTLIFTAAYIYMLYRKVVDDEAKPA